MFYSVSDAEDNESEIDIEVWITPHGSYEILPGNRIFVTGISNGSTYRIDIDATDTDGATDSTHQNFSPGDPNQPTPH